MVVSCSAYGCSNRFKKGQSIHFFNFPLKNSILLQQLVNALKRKNFKPTQLSRICSEHFTQKDFVHRPDSERPLLKIDSVPSIFKGFPTYLQPKPIKIRKLPSQRNQLLNGEDEPICEPICGSNSSIIENSLKTNCNKEVQTYNSYTNELELRRKIKLLQQKLRRTKTKVHSLEDLIDSLKNDGHIDSKQQNVIINNFNGNVLKLFKNESKNHDKTTGRRYTQEMKEFALTLHYYSPKAYNYCRSILSLPHPSFFQEVFNYLKSVKPEDRDCTLIFDAMAIRKKIIYDHNDKFIGYCDFGGIHAECQETPATEALVFMLVCLNGKWKIPIGYFLQAKSTAAIQAGLVTTAITMANDIGLCVRAVTCDGTSTNISTMTKLGCTMSGV